MGMLSPGARDASTSIIARCINMMEQLRQVKGDAAVEAIRQKYPRAGVYQSRDRGTKSNYIPWESNVAAIEAIEREIKKARAIVPVDPTPAPTRMRVMAVRTAKPKTFRHQLAIKVCEDHRLRRSRVRVNLLPPNPTAIPLMPPAYRPGDFIFIKEQITRRYGMIESKFVVDNLVLYGVRFRHNSLEYHHHRDLHPTPKQPEIVVPMCRCAGCRVGRRALQ